MKRMVSIALLLAGAALSPAARKSTTIEPPDAGTQVPGSGSDGRCTGTAPRRARSPLGDAGVTGAGYGRAAAAFGNIIYFDFDKSEIKPEFADIVTAHARNLTSHPSLKIKLEGNTDERGTREYNIGLGERRAQAVRRALMLQGVPRIADHHGELRRRAAGRRRRRRVGLVARIGAWNWSIAVTSRAQPVCCAASLAALALAGCASTPPDQDPVQIKLNDLDTRLARIERVVANQSLLDLSNQIERCAAMCAPCTTMSTS
jgi:peptidoglycan-associated lipoprotein